MMKLLLVLMSLTLSSAAFAQGAFFRPAKGVETAPVVAPKPAAIQPHVSPPIPRPRPVALPHLPVETPKVEDFEQCSHKKFTNNPAKAARMFKQVLNIDLAYSPSTRKFRHMLLEDSGTKNASGKNVSIYLEGSSDSLNLKLNIGGFEVPAAAKLCQTGDKVIAAIASSYGDFELTVSKINRLRVHIAEKTGKFNNSFSVYSIR